MIEMDERVHNLLIFILNLKFNTTQSFRKKNVMFFVKMYNIHSAFLSKVQNRAYFARALWNFGNVEFIVEFQNVSKFLNYCYKLLPLQTRIFPFSSLLYFFLCFDPHWTVNKKNLLRNLSHVFQIVRINLKHK